VDEFRLPNRGSLPNGIVAGADGNIWFTELASRKLGRLSPAGDLTEYPLPAIGTPLSIAAGPGGALWLTAPQAHAVCKITPDGHAMIFYLPETVVPSLSPAAPTATCGSLSRPARSAASHGRRTDRIPGRR